MTTKTSLALLLPAALLAAACDDSTGSRAVASDGGGAQIDVGPAERPDAGGAPVHADTGPPAPLVDAGPPGPAGEAAFVELTLEPREAIYTLEDHPQVTAEVLNRYGESIADVPLRWTVLPDGAAELDETQTLTFLPEGAGAVKACVTPDLCGRASFFVDAAEPALEVSAPIRGSLIVGDPEIEVVGRARDTGDVRVFINDEPVETDADGAFRHTLEAHFGLNRIDVVADDGVRRPPARVVMEVVWAPEVLPVGPMGVDLPESVVLRVAQTLLDRDQPLPDADDDGVITVDDLAGVLEAVLVHSDLVALLGEPLVSDGDPLTLRVTDVRMNEPDASLLFTEEGLEVFLRIGSLEIDTEGSLVVDAERFDLFGTVQVTAAAYVRVAIEATPGGGPRLRVIEADVAIESLGGVMGDSTAQAVLDTFGSLLRTVVEGVANDILDQLIRENVPELIELGLGDVLGTLENIPLDVEQAPLPPIHLDVGFTLSAPRSVARDHLALGLSGAIRQREAVLAPHPDPGVPAESLDVEPPWPAGAGLAVAARLVAVNALLHELWRQGLLRMDLTTQLPENLAALLQTADLDGRLAPMVIAAPPGSPYFFELQVGELDLSLGGPQSDVPDHFVLSLRAGLILEVGDGRIRFDVAEEPDIRAELMSVGGARPILTGDALAQLFSALVWPKVREAVGDGLELTLDEIHIGPEAFGGLAPVLTDILITPTFPVDPLIRHGWFVLSAGFEARVE